MRAPILLYHWFRDDSAPPGRSPEFATDPAHFRRQMSWLARSGARVVGLEQLVLSLRQGHRPAPRSVAITFDDAYQDFHEHALGVLSDLRLPAAVFAVAGHVGGTNDWDRANGEPVRRLLDWPQLRDLAAAGIEVGSHSSTHPDLRGVSDRQLLEECRASRERLEDGLGRPVRYFAYPFGRWDERVKAAVREAGYEAAFAVLLGLRDLLRSDDYALMRVIIHGTKGFASFRARVRLAAPRHRARG